MKRPWMPLYVGDYLADTTNLTVRQHGIYLLLLMTYWRRGKALPDDDRFLANASRTSPKVFANEKNTVMQFFDKKDGQWTHQRVENEILKSYERSESAIRSVNARWANVKQVTTTVIKKERKKDSRSLPNGNDHEFDQFWNAYPRKIGKKVAHKLFDKALKETTFGQIMLALDRQKPNWRDPKFIPHPATWLGQGRYDDGPTVGSEPAFPVPR